MNNEFSVSGLNAYVSSLLGSDPALSDLCVAGEISGFKRHSSGHLYFTLKDEYSSIRCVMFRQNAQRLTFLPSDGKYVRLTGHASLYERDGSFQIYAHRMDPAGEGDLYLRFTALKNRLEKEGFFDPEKKILPPRLPSCIGIVTSPTGAVLQDILNVSRRRFPGMRFMLYPAKVQGAGAAGTIADGIRFFDRTRLVDVILIARGGGSIEDLWAFNELEVAEAIHTCSLPIVSAVGHETDFTISDFCADLRAPTPSAAAEILVPVLDELKSGLSDLRSRLRLASSARILEQRSLLDFARKKLSVRTIEMRIDHERYRLSSCADRLLSGCRSRLQMERMRIRSFSGSFTSLGPERIMRSGFAYFTDPNGEPVVSVRKLTAGDVLSAHFADGIARITVNDIDLKEQMIK